MGTSLVKSDFVVVSWPVGRFAHTSTITPPIPEIYTVAGANNVSPGSAFRISPNDDLVVTGINLNYVYAIQFEDYGSDNTGWPDYNISTPLSTPQWITPDPADPFLPLFTIDSPTQITIAAADINLALNNYPWISTNVWYKLVLNY